MSRWDYKGEYGFASSYKEMWGRIMEWANDEPQATLPDLDYVSETCRETDAELSRLRSLESRLTEEGILEACRIGQKAYWDGVGGNPHNYIARAILRYVKEGEYGRKDQL